MEVQGHPRRAGVSAFGMSGTNAHIVLEEPPSDDMDESLPGQDERRPTELFMLSAKSRESLQQLISRYRAFGPELLQMDLRDICYTVQSGRSHYPYRLIFAVGTVAELVARLSQLTQINFGKHRIQNRPPFIVMANTDWYQERME